MRCTDLNIGLRFTLSHFRYAMVFNMKNNLGDYYVDPSTLQTFDFTNAGSAIGAQ